MELFMYLIKWDEFHWLENEILNEGDIWEAMADISIKFKQIEIDF